MPLFMTDEMQRQHDNIAHVGGERAVLSIAIRNPETLFDMATDLIPEDFSNFTNRSIFQIMLSILDDKYANIVKVNPMVIHAIAQNSGLGEEVNMQYLETISRTDFGEENVKFYIDKVKQASVRREAFRKAMTVLEESVTCEDEDIDTFTARQEEKFLDIVLATNGSNEVVRIGDMIDVVIEDRATNIRDILGVPTGYEEYDKATGALVPSRLKVIAAPAKTGKSAMALNIAKNISVDQGIPVLYVDTEMTTEEQIDRLVSIVATEFAEKEGFVVPESAISRGLFMRSDKMRPCVEKAKEIIKAAPFFHVYMPDFTPEKVHNLARKMQRQIGVNWNGYEKQFVLIFDYIKLPESSNGAIPEYQALGAIANMLKNKTAGMLGIPVLAFAQLNPRTTHNAEDVNSSHMSGSNRIVMYVNELAFLRKKTQDEMERDGKQNGNLVFSVGESRNGGTYKGWMDYSVYKGVPKIKELRNIALEE